MLAHHAQESIKVES